MGVQFLDDPSVNFEAYLTENGNVVPGSIRRGHNTLTSFGKNWLRDLVTSSLIVDVELASPGADVFKDQRRLRWISLGNGSGVDDDVEKLHAAHLIEPATYLVPIDSGTYLTDNTIRFTTLFNTDSFVGLPSPVSITEVGLFPDGQQGYYGGDPYGYGYSYYGGYYTTYYGGYYAYYYGAGLDSSSPNNTPAVYRTMETPLSVVVGVQSLTIHWTLRF